MGGWWRSSLRRPARPLGGAVGGAHRGFHEGLPRLRGGSSKGLSRRGLRPLGAVVAASAEGLPEGSAEASGRGSSRSLPLVSGRLPSSGRRGSRRAPSRACGEHHQGRPAGAFERPLLGVFGARLGAPQGTRYGGRPALGSRSQHVVSSVASEGRQRAVVGTSARGAGTRVRGAAGRRATLCDSRLRHAVRPVDRETSARRRSGGVPDRQSGPRSPRSSIGWPR